jgi:hypothetical protein
METPTNLNTIQDKMVYAREQKELGNTAFKAQDFKKAAVHYHQLNLTVSLWWLALWRPTSTPNHTIQPP